MIEAAVPFYLRYAGETVAKHWTMAKLWWRFNQVRRRIKADPNRKAYRDLALIRQTTIEFDALKPQQVVDRLKPLAVEGAPWFGSAGELVAIAYMKMCKPELAGPMFAAMAKDENVPQSIRSRARQK